MDVVELQPNTTKLWRVIDDKVTDEMIVLMEDGDLRFYTEIDVKYSYFEMCVQKEKETEK